MKRIIIIGATSGIGLEVARCYLKAGWQVGVAGRREEELEKLRQSAPGQVCTQRIDVTREDAPALLEQLIMKTGGMDVFLLSSGIGKQNLSLCPDIELQTAATNVSGFIRMVNAAYHYFEQQGKGHIAVISSIAGTKGLGSAPAYSATKRCKSHLPKEKSSCHRPALSDAGVFLETDSRMAMGEAACAEPIKHLAPKLRHCLTNLIRTKFIFLPERLFIISNLSLLL